jgi:hypothetical protein
VEENLTYIRGMLSAEQIQSEITRFWRELETNPELETDLKASGFDPAILSHLKDKEAITLRVKTSGADPISALLIVAFAPTANRALKDLWTTILLPRIRRRWGDDAIGNEGDGGD